MNNIAIPMNQTAESAEIEINQIVSIRESIFNYSDRIIKSQNLQEELQNAIKKFNIIYADTSNYPADQQELIDIYFPEYRNIPPLDLTDHLSIINNYKATGNLFKIRYIDPLTAEGEITYYDVNDKKIWLMAMSPNFVNVDCIFRYDIYIR